MLKQFRPAPACSLIACNAILATGTVASAQQASSFRYAIPQFNGKPGSELVLSNLSIQSAQAQVRLVSATGVELSKVSGGVEAGTKTRLNSSSFTPAEGTAVVQSSAALYVTGTIVHANGAIENVGPAPEAVYSILPFYLGSASKMELTISNADTIATKALIFSYSADGNV